ncbi:hypothetical protein [Nonomuraea typhae]|uniref:Lecithin:cholesterol acyltransferase n=1 Tax=Nonomuraea typhae TaxID=2603600 RepID=A0ABW7Z7J4_9ACTN
MPPHLVIVLPGILGTALKQGPRPLWDTSIAALAGGVRRFPATLDALRLPGAADVETAGLIRGWHLWPGFWAGAGYEHLRRALPAQVLEFGYDWRRSNRDSAAALKVFTERELAKWQTIHGREARVVFIAHSMGGLVARYYLEVLGGHELATQLITIGTPYSGSIRAVRALTGALLPRLPRLSEAFAHVARTFPAVAELLPAYRCVLPAPAGEPVPLTGVDLPDLPTELVRHGRAFHDDLDAAVRLGGSRTYATHVFCGKRQPTEQSIVLTGRQTRYQRLQRGADHAGDGTVAAFAAVPPEWPATGAALFHATRHAALVKNPLLVDEVLDKVNEIPHGEVMRPAYELSLDLPAVARAGEPFTVRVGADLDDLLVHADVRSLDGVELDAHVPVPPLGEGGYACTLTLPEGCWVIRVRTPAEHPPAIVEDVLPVTIG